MILHIGTGNRLTCVFLVLVLGPAVAGFGCTKNRINLGQDAENEAQEDDGGEGGEGADLTDGDSTLPGWQLVYHETFDSPFTEPPLWTEDTYLKKPYHVGPFDEDGEFFQERGGETFLQALASFRSYRKSFGYGKDNWLTVELYGRDSDKDGLPETGGQFVAAGGKAKLISTRHYDGAIIRSTQALPARYRIEVAVSNIRFGGKWDDSWVYPDGKVNGYDGNEQGDPWRFSDSSSDPLDAWRENGVYFLCITDYADPAPHNNVFIHHHRKVVMDTDNNVDEWSRIYNSQTGLIEVDGSHFLSMLWLNGEDFGDDWVGNSFTSYIPKENDFWQYDAILADKYIDGETYVFAIERDHTSYTLEITGRFQHLGQGRLRQTKAFRDYPVVWHYNQTAAEYDIGDHNQVKTYHGVAFDTWPKESSYPDHFFFGDPHINYYEGSAEFDDLKLYLPDS